MSDQSFYSDTMSDGPDLSEDTSQNLSEDMESDQDLSQDDPVPGGYELAASGYPDHGACWQVAGGVVNDPQNPGAKAICKYNSGTGLYDLYVYSPADPSSP